MGKNILSLYEGCQNMWKRQKLFVEIHIVYYKKSSHCIQHIRPSCSKLLSLISWLFQHLVIVVFLLVPELQMSSFQINQVVQKYIPKWISRVCFLWYPGM